MLNVLNMIYEKWEESEARFWAQPRNSKILLLGFLGSAGVTNAEESVPPSIAVWVIIRWLTIIDSNH